MQNMETQYTRCKSFDTFAPIGPYLVTADEIDPTQIRLQCRLNGQVMQDALVSQMAFPIPELIAELSFGMTLNPGDLIITGTPAGVGALKPGDKVAGGVDGIADFHFEIGKVQG